MPDRTPVASAQHTERRRRGRLFTRDFLLLCLVVLCCNCYLAVYYCFEQWLSGLSVVPQWRGCLLGALFGAVTLTRPVASVFLLRHSRLPAFVASILASSLILLSYRFLDPSSPAFLWLLLALRIVQGVFLGIFSSCSVAVMVNAIPLGQTARGWACFSITGLLPYAFIPMLSEPLLPLCGGETNLFALTSLLALPALAATFAIAPRLRKPEIDSTEEEQGRGLEHVLTCVRHSGLGLCFLASLFFCLTTNIGIFFIKGLAGVKGSNPAIFFSCYTGIMILIRAFASARMDNLDRGRTIPLCCTCMALAMLALAWFPSWVMIPASLFYGANLSLVYPLLAAIICDRSLPETRSLNSNIMMLCFDLSGLIAPICGGAVIHLGFGYQGVFAFGAAVITMCGATIFLDSLLGKRKATR